MLVKRSDRPADLFDLLRAARAEDPLGGGLVAEEARLLRHHVVLGGLVATTLDDEARGVHQIVVKSGPFIVEAPDRGQGRGGDRRPVLGLAVRHGGENGQLRPAGRVRRISTRISCAMEAMAARLPRIASNLQGVTVYKPCARPPASDSGR
jgi:hypothetical protein